MFALLSLGGYIFIYFVVPETKGLSEQEKKALFLPGAPYGRELRPGENQLSFSFVIPNTTVFKSGKAQPKTKKA